ncbi:hypothetical protein [Microtetraspora sp. NBRC 16547]|uniref:hypothetical protein n=1 Tax=Microtetraspora sp. NBRC 16547 TaxID=3030993 RepID=UPI0024A13C54|nr:hypothetical protein [Microtetraspora sp. NBRC 16547]GLW99526.1 hypothetical protein Misp02_36130 [Microtetraspora sp. NBRC 16547]
MNRIICVAALAAMTTLATAGAGHVMDGSCKKQVDRGQYRILINQCKFADTKAAREECRAKVRRTYTIGATNPNLDCRTYSSVTVCGKLKLSPRQRRCVRESVHSGLTRRRSEVECYAFYKGRN